MSLTSISPWPSIVLASNNAGKLRELTALLSPLGVQLIPQGELNVSEAEEPHPTFLENALAKARHASLSTGLPALADDSGICVPALGGAPGVYSARYAQRSGAVSSELKGDAANNQHLLDVLAGLPEHTAQVRRAYYYCVLVLLRHADDPQPLIAEARWWGTVLTAPQGVGGFGYDPLFFLPEQGVTVAELSAEQKNRLSHRAQAMQTLLALMRAETDATA